MILLMTSLHRTCFDFLFGTEIFGFCALMMSFFSCIAVATEIKNEEIRVQNVKIGGIRKSLNEFIIFDL
ncbi:hypothetical protein SAMN05421636_10393 [Pricia antarctica]|uniref:Uncharacterized protein n=1 Tax=Pricia antarctica TaxID=641691 RepID=A0A1G6ZTX0_9FLAO|nr:hypothetical protein SAMN05421636_10393 [Pricia antarctica]